jgi:hypothetical protein
MKQKKPNLFILGVAKSGTTTLADSLRQHPEIFITPWKEPTFFSSDMNYARGMEWYLNNFFADSDGYSYRGDASPSYLYFADKVARRIKADLPGEDPKFIIVFRNPIDRAYSHYWHNVNRGLHEKLTFEQALLAEDERLKSQDKELNDLGRIRYAYRNAGLYVRQLTTFWDFFPKDRFLLLLNEDLHRSTYSQTMGLVQTFLQVPTLEINYEHSNSSYRPRSHLFQEAVRRRSLFKELLKRVIPPENRIRLKSSLLKMNAAPIAYPPMDPSTRVMLKEVFRTEIKELAAVLGRDLTAWLA